MGRRVEPPDPEILPCALANGLQPRPREDLHGAGISGLEREETPVGEGPCPERELEGRGSDQAERGAFIALTEPGVVCLATAEHHPHP